VDISLLDWRTRHILPISRPDTRNYVVQYAKSGRLLQTFSKSSKIEVNGRVCFKTTYFCAVLMLPKNQAEEAAIIIEN
jgi:hypothetical protein